MKKLLPLQPCDIPDTYTDVTELAAELGYKRTTSVDEGIARFLFGMKITLGHDLG